MAAQDWLSHTLKRIGSRVRRSLRTRLESYLTGRRTRRGEKKAPADSSPVGQGLHPQAWPHTADALAQHWQAQVSRLEQQWRALEQPARVSVGGEVLAGEWLAVGEQLIEAWRQLGKGLVTRLGQLPVSGDWVTPEAALDEVLQNGWRKLRHVWGEGRDRLMEALQPRASTPEGAALQSALEKAMRKGETAVAESWLNAQGYLLSTLGEVFRQPPVGKDAQVEALLAAWEPLLDGSRSAWDGVLNQLASALKPVR